MKNHFFDIEFDKDRGIVKSIICNDDSFKMNWCADNYGFGQVISNSKSSFLKNREMELLSFEENENSAKALFSNGIIEAEVSHSFIENGNLRESFKIKNLLDVDVFLEHGNLGLSVPFNDVYTCADDCMVRRCNTHIWCGYDVTYVNALKMGESEINLGLFVTKGTIRSYSVEGSDSNIRGKFILNSEHIELLPHGEYEVEWEIFVHKGKEDFYKKLEDYERFVDVKAEHFTVFKGEDICFDFSIKTTDVSVFLKGEKIPVSIKNGRGYVKYTPYDFGEYRFDIYTGDVHTYTEFYVSECFDKLIEKRVHHIVDNQQVINPESRLHGAYVIYDLEEDYKIFNHTIICHNACAERLAMSLLISEYLLMHPDDEKVKNSFFLFVKFMFREFVDIETGRVFGNTGKSEVYLRLYNAPWAVSLITQIFLITKEEKYLKYALKIIDKYYNFFDGYKFYPNGFLIYRIVDTFKKYGSNEDYEFVLKCFTKHVENMIKKGTSYPEHEVNYEQTIVSPAASFIAEIGRLTKDERYTAEAKKQLINLERFNGNAPSFHLYEIPIRYWDVFFGGKTGVFGDTFPQYWSSLTARSYKNYYLISGDESYLSKAEECMRNTLCLFNPDGTAHCAYLYPFKCSGVKCQKYDPWENDQDYALFFALINEFFE